jgi:hypothetical protein
MANEVRGRVQGRVLGEQVTGIRVEGGRDGPKQAHQAMDLSLTRLKL